MFWFDKSDPRAVFVDKRMESFLADNRKGRVMLSVRPDVVADFTALPFPSRRFALVVFDPPHLKRNGKNSRMAKKYGTLRGDWRDELRRGFAECFRVLRRGGVLVFKWNEVDIPVSEILILTPVRPLFGNRCGKQAKTHWIVFIKS
jgi:SAM-dependent methyltransferase